MDCGGSRGRRMLFEQSLTVLPCLPKITLEVWAFPPKTKEGEETTTYKIPSV